MRALAVVLILSLCGCVPYVAYRKVRPDVFLVVRDAWRRPVPGAQVTLISTVHLDGAVRSRDTAVTAADGTVRFAGARALRFEVLFLYRGDEIRFWNWCVEKEGFVTHFTSGPRTKVFSDESAIVLRKGTAKACPAAFRAS